MNHTNIQSVASHLSKRPARSATAPRSPVLSPGELRRIVAEIIG